MTDPTRENTEGLPRWVKISGIVAILVALLVAIVLLTGGGGEHGPSRHSQVAYGAGPASSSAWLGHLRGDLGQVLGTRSAHPDRQADLDANSMSDPRTDDGGGTEKVCRPGHVEECLVDRDPLDRA